MTGPFGGIVVYASFTMHKAHGMLAPSFIPASTLTQQWAAARETPFTPQLPLSPTFHSLLACLPAWLLTHFTCPCSGGSSRKQQPVKREGVEGHSGVPDQDLLPGWPLKSPLWTLWPCWQPLPRKTMAELHNASSWGRHFASSMGKLQVLGVVSSLFPVFPSPDLFSFSSTAIPCILSAFPVSHSPTIFVFAPLLFSFIYLIYNPPFSTL